jgi:glycerophosphoryl diester phosphodiesterase
VERLISLWWSAARPPVVAHRGACLRAPENTLAAFRLAVDLGADGIELDAKLTADGQVVIVHDTTLDRTTDGSGPVAGRTLRELKALDAGSRFSAPFAGERIPTLAEVFESLGQRCLINVELTNYASPRDSLPQRVAQLVRDFHLEARVLLSSFNPIALRAARRRAPELPLGLLVGPTQAGWTRRVFPILAPHEAFHPHESLIREETVRSLHRGGRKVVPWTVDRPERIRGLLSQGVDAIITDDPEVAREVRDGVG